MIELDIAKPKRQKTIETEEDDVFRMLILGDFGAEEVGRPVLVDRDNLEDVMEKWKVSVTVPPAGKIPIRTLDSFHPDHLYRRLHLFQTLRDARDRLEDPDTYRQTAEQIFNPAAPQATVDILSPASLLDQAVEEAGGGKAVDPFTDYVRKLVAPYTVPKPDPKLPEMLAEIDASISGNMRTILHHADFQNVESAWRALDMLVRAVETGVELKIYIMDLSQKLFQGDLVRAQKLQDTVLHSLLSAQKWNYVIAAYTFDDSEVDVETLGRVALLMDHAKTRFLAAATPDFEKWEEPRAGLEELKRLPEIRQVALALPRWIVRMPYGKKSSAAEAFEFEELEKTPKHEHYCWANPAFACARLIAESRATGEETLNINSLPIHLYKDGGETEAKPCAEFLMTQKSAEKLTDAGLMPLISMKGQDWIRLAGFRALNGAGFVD
jgi:type VI secretion system protein ImpC